MVGTGWKLRARVGGGRREEERGALLLKQTKTGRADPAWGLGRFPVIGSCRGSGAAVRAERTRSVAAQALRLFHISQKCSLEPNAASSALTGGKTDSRGLWVLHISLLPFQYYLLCMNLLLVTLPPPFEFA